MYKKHVYQEATPEKLPLTTYKVLPLDNIYSADEKFALHVVETSSFLAHKEKKNTGRLEGTTKKLKRKLMAKELEVRVQGNLEQRTPSP